MSLLKSLPVLFTLFFTAMSATASAASDIFKIKVWEGTSCGGSGGPTGSCGLCDALIVASNIIDDLFKVAILVSTVMIIYGAVRLMTSGGSEKSVSEGKDAIKNAVIGLVIALAAWIIINTLLHILTGNPNLPWNKISC